MSEIAPKEILPNELCLACKGCCRFAKKECPFAPVFIEEEARNAASDKIGSYFNESPKGGFKVKLTACDGHFLCPFFNLSENKCSIYSKRPLDCRLYPFMLIVSNDDNACLGIDTNCPFAKERLEDTSLQNYASYLADFIEQGELQSLIAVTGGLFMDA